MIFVKRFLVDGAAMSTVTVSPKYQIVIPKEVREKMNIEPGQKVSVMVLDGVIHLVPESPIEQMKGFSPDIDSRVLREEDRS